jgi:hypothetical protein
LNVRRLALVPKTQNPKALALFLSASLQLPPAGGHEDVPELMVERLIALRSPGIPYSAWGYSFPWQTRGQVVPRGAPNLVCTTFVAGALLDMYERRQDDRCLAMAASAAEYMLHELYWTAGPSTASFSYPLPQSRVQIHNANLLAAALLCRLYAHTAEARFLKPALRVVRSAAAHQRDDGSWAYGDAPTQQWIDNFHTGYNLCALESIADSLGTAEFDPCLRRGFDFFRRHFLLDDGAVRYFHDRTYPIDVHCVAQTIITLVTLERFDAGNIPAARKVFDWAMRHLWDERGFFYYRKLRFCTIRTSYMRWSQAWMLLAIATLLHDSTRSTRTAPVEQAIA